VVDEDARRAEKLLAWFERWPHPTITLRDIQQRAPRPLRKLTAAKRVVSILERLGCLEGVPDDAATDGRCPRDIWHIVRRGSAVIHYDRSAARRWRLIWSDQIALVERALAEAVSHIEAQRPPEAYGVSAHRWGLFQSDVRHLVERWGHRATTLGLGVADLIGWSGIWSFSAVQRSLAWRLSGYHTIVSLERDRAICDGGRTVFWKVADGCGWSIDAPKVGHEVKSASPTN
jgi:hypothetical protein